MEIHIAYLHTDEQAALTRDIQQKMGRLGRKYSMIRKAQIVLRKEKSDKQNHYGIQATVALTGRTIYANEQEKDFRTAFDKLLQDLEHQLHKTKELNQEKR